MTTVERVVPNGYGTVTEPPARSLDVNAYAALFNQFRYNGNTYVVGSTPLGHLADNSVVGACLMRRQFVLSEARFAWQHVEAGDTEDEHGTHHHERRLFYTPDLDRIRRPWPNASDGDLLAQMDFDISLWGNSFWRPERDGTMTWLDPTRVTILTGDRTDAPRSERTRAYGDILVGYAVHSETGERITVFAPDQLVHHKPRRSANPFKGSSWIVSACVDVDADTEMSTTKVAYLRNGMKPGLVFKFNPEHDDPDLEEFADALEARHQGADQFFKTIYLTGGADVDTLGSNFKDMDLSSIQGGTENRITVASGVPAVIAGTREGLQGSSLNTGNYESARRLMADSLIRPLLRSSCMALQLGGAVVPPDDRVRLWYNGKGIHFFKEDLKTAAEITQLQMASLNSAVTQGWEYDAAVQAVTQNDLTVLYGRHTGLVSVQLLPPGETDPDPNRGVVWCSTAEAMELISEGRAVLYRDETRLPNRERLELPV